MRAVDNAGALRAHIGQLGRPAILKTRRFGYDGKGQVALREGSDVGAASGRSAARPCILEGFVDFEREVSVDRARAAWTGRSRPSTSARTSTSTTFSSVTRAPGADRRRRRRRRRWRSRTRILDALDYVGVIAVEMFLWPRDAAGAGARRLVVNEIAPRVHNSGHWTIDGAETSQFEQHVRAIAGWPLGSPGAARRGSRCAI